VIGNIITPRIQAEAVQVHPVLVLLSVVAAGNLFGILGVFLAVPALAVARVLLEFVTRNVRFAIE
jgi:predicted PurR-regulated permease PerM